MSGQTITRSELAERQAAYRAAYESGALRGRCAGCDRPVPLRDAKDSRDGRVWHEWCTAPLRMVAAQTYFGLAMGQWQRFLDGREFDTFGFGLDSPWDYMDRAMGMVA